MEDCDFEIVRELAGDIYFGAHEIKGEGKNASARDVAQYSASRKSSAWRGMRLNAQRAATGT